MTRSSQRHVPVLLTEAIEYLQVREGSTVVDCTLGLAGHAAEIVRRLGPTGKLIGFDRDPEALGLAKEKLDRICEELGNRAPRSRTGWRGIQRGSVARATGFS